MAALLVLAGRTIGQLVRYAPRSNGVALYGNPGGGIVGGPGLELEIQEALCLCSCSINKDTGNQKGQGDLCKY